MYLLILAWRLLQLLAVVFAQDTFVVSSVKGYSDMPDCAQSALYYGVYTSVYDNCQRDLPATTFFGCLCNRDSTRVEAEITNAFEYYASSYTLCGPSELASATSVWGNLCVQLIDRICHAGESPTPGSSKSLPAQTAGANNPSPQQDGLSTTAKIAIGVVCPVVGLTALTFLGWWWMRRRRRNSTSRRNKDSTKRYIKELLATANTNEKGHA
ncbi:MAG: hypothetical protein Q9219_000465 [cf. Caloplaca sp. 3 TL-2023]